MTYFINKITLTFDIYSMLSRYFAWTRLHEFNEISRNARQPESWTGWQRWRNNESFVLFEQLVLNWSSSTRSSAAVFAPARNSHNRKHMNHNSFNGDELSRLILIFQLRIISSGFQSPSKAWNSTLHGPQLIPHTTHQEERRRWLWSCKIYFLQIDYFWRRQIECWWLIPPDLGRSTDIHINTWMGALHIMLELINLANITLR